MGPRIRLLMAAVRSLAVLLQSNFISLIGKKRTQLMSSTVMLSVAEDDFLDTMSCVGGEGFGTGDGFITFHFVRRKERGDR